LIIRLQQALSTTAVRLSALFLGLFASAAIALVLYVTAMSTRIIEADARAAIDAKLELLLERYESVGLPGLVRAVEREARVPGAQLFLITDAAGRSLTGNVAAVGPGVLDQNGWIDETFDYIRDDSGEIYTALARVVRLNGGLTLLIGRDVRESERFRDVVRQALGFALGIMTLGGLVIWLMVGRRALTRIDAVSSQSSKIIAGDLTKRLPISGSGDEFDRLSSSLNAMLDTISKLDSGVRDVSNNIAHDLKTPLTRIAARIEAALRKNTKAAELKTTLAANLQDTNALIQTFNAILTISKLEAGAIIEGRELASLGGLLSDVVELYQPSGEEQRIEITADVTKDVDAFINRPLMFQALSNLIENSLKHGGSKMTRVSLRFVALNDQTATIEVSDNGIGIAEHERDKAMQRFVRLDPSRTNDGTGLGLSLASAIASAHGGRLLLGDNKPGLKAMIEVPLNSYR
jgi:signal transduction histidine kinase